MNILLVDDALMMLKLLQRIVSGKDRTVLQAQSFEECRQIVINSHVDLVITDLNLPDQNGYAVANMLHQHSPKVPIFLVTGCQDDEDIRFASLAGFTRIFTKPIQFAPLKEAIDAVERGLRPAPDPVLI